MPDLIFLAETLKPIDEVVSTLKKIGLHEVIDLSTIGHRGGLIGRGNMDYKLHLFRSVNTGYT